MRVKTDNVTKTYTVVKTNIKTGASSSVYTTTSEKDAKWERDRGKSNGDGFLYTIVRSGLS